MNNTYDKVYGFDMHTHSHNSLDSQCSISDMAKNAARNNLRGFAVTDHCDIADYKSLDLHKIIQGSIDEIESVSRLTNGPTILKGIEMGEAFWYPEIVSEILKKYDFDVVIGSVHAVKFKMYEMYYSKIDFSTIKNDVLNAYLEAYFNDMITMTEICDFDILAHLSCPLRYINGKYKRSVDLRKYEGKIKKILNNIINRSIALEINTSCVFNSSAYCEFMPEEWIIKMYKDMGGYLITTGSDAHIASNSANRFDELYNLLKRIGFKDTYYYKNRTAVKCPLKN